ncbi:DNA polymerase [Vibrio phage BONAISHI]|nr:DNA polymerase [Vibrio phage BONAISHI]
MTEELKVLRQVMHVTYARNQEAKTEDALIVKERLRCVKTGREKPHIRIVENYKRKFWVTKKGCRNHEQKREYEFLENLDEYEATDAALPYRLNKVLGNSGGNFPRLSHLCRSPYVYGTDIRSTVLYKSEMDAINKERNGDWNPDYSIAVADYETNMHSDEEEIITGAISMGNKAIIVASESFMSGIVNPEAKMQEVTERYLEKEIVKRNMTIKYRIVKDDLAVVKEILRFAHILKPDFLVFWNMLFDVNKMIESCERHNVDPANLFSDPAIPAKYRYFRWQEDRPNKVSASGKKTNKDPSETWSVVHCPASFYVIDAMCVFRMLRVVEGKRHSYSLDAILQSTVDIRKLEIPGLDGNHNILWHRNAQQYYKPEYCAYNLFDCISVEILDEETNDLSKKIGLYADGSDFGTLASNPKRLANAIHTFLLKEGKVLCSTSDNMTEKEDRHPLDKTGWIVTLANELAEEAGIPIFQELHDLILRIAKFVSDIDITSGYPTAHSAGNVSRSTTLVEVCAIKGLTRHLVKELAVNMMAVPANSVEIGNKVLGLPRLEEWEKALNGLDTVEKVNAMLDELEAA